MSVFLCCGTPVVSSHSSASHSSAGLLTYTLSSFGSSVGGTLSGGGAGLVFLAGSGVSSSSGCLGSGGGDGCGFSGSVDDAGVGSSATCAVPMRTSSSKTA